MLPIASVEVHGGKYLGEFLFYDTERRLLERRSQVGRPLNHW